MAQVCQHHARNDYESFEWVCSGCRRFCRCWSPELNKNQHSRTLRHYTFNFKYSRPAEFNRVQVCWSLLQGPGGRRFNFVPVGWTLREEPVSWFSSAWLSRDRGTGKWDEQVLRIGDTVTHEKASAAPHRKSPTQTARVEMTIGIDLGDVWSHYCTLNEEGEIVDRGRCRTAPKGVEKPRVRSRSRIVSWSTMRYFRISYSMLFL
jgi:hypothetical protein